jgi:hypothetical protein
MEERVASVGFWKPQTTPEWSARQNVRSMFVSYFFLVNCYNQRRYAWLHIHKPSNNVGQNWLLNSDLRFQYLNWLESLFFFLSTMFGPIASHPNLVLVNKNKGIITVKTMTKLKMYIWKKKPSSLHQNRIEAATEDWSFTNGASQI